MQMSGTHGQLPANKSPPTPMVQTPIITAANEIQPVFPNISNTNTPNITATSAEAVKDSSSSSAANVQPSAVAPSSQIETAALDGHNRTVSQSSGASAPELTAINNSAIISDKTENPKRNVNENPAAGASSS